MSRTMSDVFDQYQKMLDDLLRKIALQEGFVVVDNGSPVKVEKNGVEYFVEPHFFGGIERFEVGFYIVNDSTKEKEQRSSTCREDQFETIVEDRLRKALRSIL